MKAIGDLEVSTCFDRLSHFNGDLLINPRFWTGACDEALRLKKRVRIWLNPGDLIAGQQSLDLVADSFKRPGFYCKARSSEL